MMKVEDIEKAIAQLAPADLDKFRAWYEAFDAQRFDERIEAMLRPGNWIEWRMRLSPNTAQAAPVNYEALRQPWFLGSV